MRYSQEKILNQKAAKIIDKVADLKKFNRYRGLFLFGSAARGEFKEGSDIDLKFLVEGAVHPEVCHTFVDDIKLDFSFNSVKTLEKETKEQAEKNKRMPIIAECIILFDKDNELKRLKDEAQKIKPSRYKKEKHRWVNFVIQNELNKIEKHIDSDPNTANFIMHVELKGIVKMHYQLNGRWHKGSKHELKDLERWDPEMYKLVVDLINETNTRTKYNNWRRLIDYVLMPIGGRVEIQDTSCDCDICRGDIERLEGVLSGL